MQALCILSANSLIITAFKTSCPYAQQKKALQCALKFIEQNIELLIKSKKYETTSPQTNRTFGNFKK